MPNISTLKDATQLKKLPKDNLREILMRKNHLLKYLIVWLKETRECFKKDKHQ